MRMARDGSPREPRSCNRAATQSSGTPSGGRRGAGSSETEPGPAGRQSGSSSPSGIEPRNDSAASCRWPLEASALPPHGPSVAVERGERAAGLAHDHVDGGHVVHARAPARRPGRRHPRRRACRTRSRRRPGSASTRRISATKSSPWPRSSQPCREEYDSDASSRRRTSETWHWVALSSDRPVHAPLPAEAHQRRWSCGRRHDAEHDLVVDGERDQGGPDGDAADEVLGAVDRVDDPAPLAVARRPVLLAGHRVARADPRRGCAGSSPRQPGRRR